jgi:hypothetical protein
MSGGFISEFANYVKTRTDCPPTFHYHAAMSALAYALGNHAYCDGWGRPIYPNLWIVVIAKSGYGKSVPLDMAQSILQQAGLGEGMLPSSFSQEGLLTAISKTPISMFCLQEFSSFVKQLDREYNSGAMAWLTELFDVPDTYNRVLMSKRETHTVTLTRPCITILGASSPDWFAESYKASMLRGGFLARFLFCPSEKAGEYVGYPGPRRSDIEVGLAQHLIDVAENMHGAFDTSKVRDAFNDWDRSARDKLRKDCPPEMSGIRSRAGLMVWKAAMLIHASRDPGTMTLTKDDLNTAIKYVEQVHGQAEKYLSEEVASDRWEVDRLKVLEVVNRAGGELSYSKTLQNSHLSARNMKEAVETLEQSGRLLLEKNGRERLVRIPPSTNGVVH